VFQFLLSEKERYMVYILSLQNLVSNSTGGTNSSAGGVLPTNEVNDQVTHG
jgi:hypothetical protein